MYGRIYKNNCLEILIMTTTVRNVPATNGSSHASTLLTTRNTEHGLQKDTQVIEVRIDRHTRPVQPLPQPFLSWWILMSQLQ